MKNRNTNTLLIFFAKRFVYSIFILLGVLILTFLLFRVAAGDPARALLGKNPSPKEVEEMRIALGAGKPLIYGYWQKTELYTSVSFKRKHSLKGIKFKGNPEIKNNALNLTRNDLVVFRPNFEGTNLKLKLSFEYQGNLHISIGKGKRIIVCDSNYLKYKSIEFDNLPGIISFSSESSGSLKNVSFHRRLSSPYDSQLMEALQEIISFKDTFPYLSFFNFGRTLVSKEEVTQVLREGVFPSLFLMIPIFIGELVLGIIFAMTAVVFHGKFPDKFLMFLSVAGMSVSYIVFMIAGQYLFAYYYHIFPIWGFENYRYLLLPVIIGIISGVGGGIRFYRTIFINELKKEYLRTAHAKGISPFFVYFKHLMKNAAVPIITRSAAILPFLFTGSLLLESFFGIPGLGYAGINALMNSDIQLLKALVIMTAILFIVVNTIADIINAWADPRVDL